MARIVMKFGGTSVADLERIRNAAGHVKREYDAGNEIAVVVSAMAGETNRLVDLVRSVGGLYDTREYDTIVSSGEQVTSGLMALVLQSMDIPARSWLGWQIPMQCDDTHGKARIENIIPNNLDTRLQQREVAVCAGFQGISDKNRITTLGRGGSDTTAVAIAAALKADRCDIYTDVDGIYTCDPRIVPKARKLDKISFEEMLELASSGSKVLQTRSVEIAMRHHVVLQVRSSFNNEIGTFVVDEGDKEMEGQYITGIAADKNDAKITVVKFRDRPGVSAKIFGSLADHGIFVDMIVQSVSADGEYADMTFTVPKDDVQRAEKILNDQQKTIDFDHLLSDSNIIKISVAGVGMRSHSGVARTMFETLAEKGINISSISTSEIKISILIHEDYAELAMRALHSAYGLDKES